MRVLIIDPEYLVALEAERILGSVAGAEIEIATPHNYPVALENGSFDVVVIDANLLSGGQGEASRRVRAAGAALVLTTLDDDLVTIPGFEGIAIVAKPFDELEFAEAVKKALSSD